jgi:lipopolysaccharide/colanic/teichoic acid biosynthesis glycosyltransferase
MRCAAGGVQITATDDERTTRAGRVLRRTKLDELPELWNVLKGDMALVGPRPEVPRYVNLENPAWRQVLAARPGLTDPVTISLRDEEELLAMVSGDRESFYLKHLQPVKLKGYLEYLQRRSWLTDARVLWDTCLTFILRRSPKELLRIEHISDAPHLTLSSRERSKSAGM